MKYIKYALLSFLLITAVACSKKSETKLPSQKYSDKPLHLERASFTAPRIIRQKRGDPSVMNQLIAYINHASEGSVVHINIYLFSYDPILNAITRAYKRGVTFKILIDNENHAHTRNLSTITFLQNLLDSPSVVIPVVNDSRSTGSSAGTAIDHNKYVLFSEVDLPKGIAKNLVWASSHNFSKGQTEKLEDAIIMTNKGLYNAFVANWKQVKKYADGGMRNFEFMKIPIGDSITAFFYPRRKNGQYTNKNTVIEQLDKLDESGYDQDTVRVLMSEMHASAGLEDAQKLTELQENGVTVQVITRLETPQSSQAVLNELNNNLKNAGGYVKLLDKSIEGTVHSKTMLIKGVYEGKMQEIILTGSLNWHIHALNTNNNFQLLLKNSKLFDTYWKNWEQVEKLF